MTSAEVCPDRSHRVPVDQFHTGYSLLNHDTQKLSEDLDLRDQTELSRQVQETHRQCKL